MVAVARNRVAGAVDGIVIIDSGNLSCSRGRYGEKRWGILRHRNISRSDDLASGRMRYKEAHSPTWGSRGRNLKSNKAGGWHDAEDRSLHVIDCDLIIVGDKRPGIGRRRKTAERAEPSAHPIE